MMADTCTHIVRSKAKTESQTKYIKKKDLTDSCRQQGYLQINLGERERERERERESVCVCVREREREREREFSPTDCSHET